MDYEINFELADVSGFKQEFRSLKSLLRFIKKEYEIWVGIHRELSDKNLNSNGNYLNFYRNFEPAIQVIESVLSDKQTHDYQVQPTIEHVSQYLVNMKSSWLYSGHALTHQYLEILRNFESTTAAAFLDYILNKHTNNVSHQQHFQGYLLAYEFLNQNSEIIKRRESEKRSLNQIRRNFVETQDNLIQEVEEFKIRYEEWEYNKKRHVDQLYRVQKYLGERRLKKQVQDFDLQLQNWKDQILDLESTYNEKLKLQGPAKYWKDAAKRYEKHRMNWARAIVLFVILGVVIFYSLLSQWFSGEKLPLQLSSLQGAILFASLAAMFTYLMKVLSKMAFSSFHLMIDAQEREQLTYLYLALTHESEIDKTSRDIVLQSLFSRSETGLLAKETGPTMPTITEMMPKMNKT